jgi:hypothetical protein
MNQLPRETLLQDHSGRRVMIVTHVRKNASIQFAVIDDRPRKPRRPRMASPTENAPAEYLVEHHAHIV